MINPVLYEVRNATRSLDSVLHIIASVFNPMTKSNIQGILENLNRTTASFAFSAASLQTILNPQSGALAHALDNVNSFTYNLVENTDTLNGILSNANRAAAHFASLDFRRTMNTLDSSVAQLNIGIQKINSKEGSIGLLLNDTKIYDNLAATSNKLNILLDDIRVHPKRYLSFSVFGKRDKGNYITAPLIDDTLKFLPTVDTMKVAKKANE